MDAFQDTPPEVDPAADFLAREQGQLASLDDQDDFGFTNPSDPQPGADESAVELNASQDDFLGGAISAEPAEVPIQDQADLFADNEAEEPAATNGPSDLYSAISHTDRLMAEPEKIKKWREEQTLRLQEKDEAEAKTIEEWKAAAKKELEDWYRHHEEQLGKTKENNRAAQKAFIAEQEDTTPGGEFERVCRLCDFNPKNSKNTRDVSRMRSVLLQLKQHGLVR